jgi:hypothetical protein
VRPIDQFWFTGYPFHRNCTRIGDEKDIGTSLEKDIHPMTAGRL